MKCVACQSESVPGARFCSQCGARLVTEDVPRGDARFCSHCGQALSHIVAPVAVAPGAYTPKHLAEKILTSRAALEGERKQVTVLFADVENFTRLGERLDPEDLHQVMDRVFAILLEVIHRYEGTVNQFTGDGVMALFGAPVALEDHALRAVEAALEVQRAMASRAEEFRQSFSSVPSLRIGLNSGRVVVGKIGDDLRMDYTAQGDTVNLAARLQAIADAGTVAVSASTQRLVGSAVECVSLGLHRVKGKDQPVEVFRPLRLLSGTARTDEHGLAPLIGRAEELGGLRGLFADVQQGRPRAALIIGEAGVGKSRLLHEFRRHIDSGTRWFVGHCVPYGRATPYRPIIEVLRATFGLAEGDSEETALAKLDNLLTRVGDETRTIGPALRWLLALGPPDPSLSLLSASDRKTAITRALDVLTRRSAATAPTVFVFEACQWLDPASEEYLTGISERIQSGSVFFVFTCRPDEAGRVPLALTGERMVVKPLDPAESRSFVATLAPDVSSDLVMLVADRTGGNPLFLEEVTRSLVETGAARIPPTVEDVLMARVDRLPASLKSVLQTTSVIGQEFSKAVLERVVDDLENLSVSLDRLVDLGFLRGGAEGVDVYSCAQPLLHEVTYEGLLNQHRKVLHRKIGETLEALFPQRLSEHVEDLARHFARAEEWPRALFYHREAGRKAAALCANAQAARWLQRALELLARLPDNPDRTRQTIEIQLDLCRCLFQLGQLDEVLRLAREAESLAQALDDQPRLGQVYAYVSNYHYMKGAPDQAITYGRRCLAIGEQEHAPGLQRAARQYLGTSYHVLGEYGMAEETLSDQIRALETDPDAQRMGPINLSYVSSCAWLAFTLSELGDFARAHEAAARAAPAAAAAGHPYVQAIATAFQGLVWHMQGEIDRAMPLFDTSFHLCRDHHLDVFQPVAAAMLGHASVVRGKLQEGLQLLWESSTLTEKLGVQAYRALWTTYLAEGLLVNGQTAAAVEAAERALALAVQNKEQGNHTRALQVLGSACIHLGPSGFERANEHLRQALEQAERLRMRPLIAACYFWLAILARREGDAPRADGFHETAHTLANEIGLVFWWERFALV
jgi:class 3 adenylate cyclase/tetratricopeptide (TPR) repeat protein